MRILFCQVLVAAALLGCGRSSDTASNAKLQAAAVAGGVALSTINRCLLQIEQARNTSVPECDAAEQVRAYEEAKARVPLAAVPALRPLDDNIEIARTEVVADLIRLVVPPAKRSDAPAAPSANALYPLADHSQWRAH
ncbi:MAG: hypothetical protein JWQ33_2281 [Ramlibacter sp.]|nr:hypothetical protein [Ramlibacter sp.]